MRLALVSDIHGNLIALEAVLADIALRNVQAIVNLGDSLSGPLLPLETARFLMSRDWVQLAGNHERQLLGDPAHMGASDAYAHGQLGAAEFAWVRSLKHTLPLTPEVLLCHGTPHVDDVYFLETADAAAGGVRAANAGEIATRLGNVAATVIACGHTHVPRAVRTSLGQLIVNPGSVGLQAYRDDQPFVHAVENGAPDARYAIIEERGGRWFTELIAVPYDHETMARIAQAHGREDWAFALRTGTMPAPC